MTAGIYDEIVPGTGVTASLLSWLIFNRYQMATPAYRESKGRLKDMNWDNLFAYRKDGEYAISNCAAEQAIRPQTVQRKNSLFYCSTKGAVISAIYNTFIETCKQAGISFREYFRRVILELKHGRTDYARSNLFACYQRDARTCFR